MSRRFCRKWVVWLLPILALRAFLPVGFMWTAGPGGLELSFCPGQGSVLVAGTHHHHDGGPGSERADSPCPFGMAAVALSSDVDHLAAALPEPGPVLVAPRSIGLSTAGPVRADRIRGPPTLS